MRTPLFFLIFLFHIQFFAQDFKDEFKAIREAEAKTALKKMALKINSNTGNYDLRYHRLEFNIDPAVNQISGDVTS